MGADENILTVESVIDEIVKNAALYFEETKESVSDSFLCLLAESLVDEYKAKRNYPGYFTDEQIDADVVRYFGRKKAYFATKVIPAMYGKVGAEGQKSHAENGISRAWETETWFADVIPYCDVI